MTPLSYRALWMIAGFLVSVGCFEKNGAENVILNGPVRGAHAHVIKIPEQSDWIDHGLILSNGEQGAWDYLLWGGFTGTVVKKDSLFFLYYQGARDYSDEYETVTYRAIGVATSSDGLHFTKYRHNPVLTWFPNQGLEEGAVSGGATLDENGEVVVYYGANAKVNASLVNADTRLAVSKNGLDFSDAGLVLDHKNRKLWGAGDEVFPIISFRDRGAWYVYYIPNGTPQRGALGVAWGPGRDHLPHSSAVSARGKKVDVWGMGGYARIGADTYALFLNNVRKPGLEVRTVQLDAPAQVSVPIRRYDFDNFAQATVYLDHEAQTWYMFYRTSHNEGYHVKVAPVVKHEQAVAH